MKKIISMMVVIAIILLAIPFAIGLITEQRFNATMASLNQQSSGNVKTTAYQRGWFHSQATTQLTFSDQGNDVTLTFHSMIRHGLLLWGNDHPISLGFADIDTQLELQSDLNNKMTQTFGEQALPTLSTHILYDGSFDSSLSTPELSHRDESNHASINIHPLDFQIHSDKDVKHIHGSLNWLGLDIQGEQGKARWGNSHSQFSLDDRWNGKMDWHTDFLDIHDGQRQFMLSELNLTASSQLDEQQRVSMTQNLQFENLQINQRSFDDATLKLSIEHIPVSALERMQAMQKEIFSLPIEQRQQAAQTMGFQMLSLIPDMIAAEPVIDIQQLTLTTPEGTLVGDLHFSIQGISKQDMFNIAKLKKHIQASMNIQFPAALIPAEKSQQLLALQKKGWLQESHGMLHGTLLMHDGMLTINNHPIDLPF